MLSQNLGSRTGQLGFQPRLCHVLAVLPGANCTTSLCCGFLPRRMTVQGLRRGGTEFPPAPQQVLRQWSCDKRSVSLIILASVYRGGSHVLCLRHMGAQTHSNCSLPSSQEGVSSQGDRRVRMTRAINAARGPVGARLEAAQALLNIPGVESVVWAASASDVSAEIPVFLI